MATVWDMDDRFRMTRKDAQWYGRARYWDPEAPCPRHEQVYRYTSNGACMMCVRETNRRAYLRRKGTGTDE